MNIMVTGVGGLIGGHLARFLAARGHSVTIVSRRPIDWRTDDPPVREEVFDISQPFNVEGPIDAIVHCAGSRSDDEALTQKLLSENVVATFQLIEFAKSHDVRRIILLSTMSVYGRVGSPTVNEITPINEPRPYGVSKLMAEAMLADLGESVSVFIIRLPAVLARGAEIHWPARLASRLIRNERVTVFNPDAMFNNAISIHDLSRVCEGLLGTDLAGHFRMVIASREPVQIRSMVNLMKRELGSTSLVDVVPGSHPSYVIDFSLAQTAFGFNPMTISEALTAFCADLRNLPGRN